MSSPSNPLTLPSTTTTNRNNNQKHNTNNNNMIQRNKPNREHVLDPDPGNLSLKSPPLRQSWPAVRVTQEVISAGNSDNTNPTELTAPKTARSLPLYGTAAKTNTTTDSRQQYQQQHNGGGNIYNDDEEVPPIPVGKKRRSLVSLGNDSLGEPPARDSSHSSSKSAAESGPPERSSSCVSRSSSSSRTSSSDDDEEELLLSDIINDLGTEDEEQPPPLLSANQRKFESSGDITVIQPIRSNESGVSPNNNHDNHTPTTHKMMQRTEMPLVKEDSNNKSDDDGESEELPPPLLDMRRFESLGDDTVVAPNRQRTDMENQQSEPRQEQPPSNSTTSPLTNTTKTKAAVGRNKEDNENENEHVAPKRHLIPTTSDGGHLHTVAAPIRIESKIVYNPLGTTPTGNEDGSRGGNQGKAIRDSNITIIDQNNASSENDNNHTDDSFNARESSFIANTRRKIRLTTLDETQQQYNDDAHDLMDNDEKEIGKHGHLERNLSRKSTIKTNNLTKARFLANINVEPSAGTTNSVDIEYVPKISDSTPPVPPSLEKTAQQHDAGQNRATRSSTARVSNVIIDELLMDKSNEKNNNEKENEQDTQTSLENTETGAGVRKDNQVQVALPPPQESNDSERSTSVPKNPKTQEAEKVHLTSQGGKGVSDTSEASAKEDKASENKFCFKKKIGEITSKPAKGEKAKVATDRKKQQKQKRKGHRFSAKQRPPEEEKKVEKEKTSRTIELEHSRRDKEHSEEAMKRKKNIKNIFGFLKHAK